jgi:hypothetical protein
MNATDLLQEAAALIAQRGAERDLPAERSMRRTVTAFNALSGQTLTETQGWLFVAVLKLSRALAGSFQRDDLLDAAAYVALALESELAQKSPGADSGESPVNLGVALAASKKGVQEALRPPHRQFDNPALP